MLHVSSVSKFTMDCPPLASSVLLGGRNRATTTQKVSASLGNDTGLDVAVPFIVLPAEVLLQNTVSKQRHRGFTVHLRHVYYPKRQAREAREALREPSRERDKGVSCTITRKLGGDVESQQVVGLERIAFGAARVTR